MTELEKQRHTTHHTSRPRTGADILKEEPPVKFVKEYTGANLSIPSAALKVSHFEKEKVELHALEDVVVVTKGQMTAMEMIHVMESLNQLSSELAVQLAMACGPCGGCGGDGCPYEDDEGYDIDLPDYLKEEAGIPKNAKLCATVEAEGAVTIMEAGYDHDLRDVPPRLLAVIQASGICLGELEERLITEEIVYGA